MSTVTAAINAQSIGTGGNVGNGKFPYKLTKSAGSTVFSVEAKLVTGSGAPVTMSKVIARFCSSSFSQTAAEAVEMLKGTKELEIKFAEASAGTRLISSELFSFLGDYAYLWVDVPPLTVAATLTVNFVELP